MPEYGKKKSFFCGLIGNYIHIRQIAYLPFRRAVTTFRNSDSLIGGIFAIFTLC
jgi:hypothetical protein